MINCKMIDMPAFAGEYGQLNAIEGGHNVPFKIQRVYYITKVPKNVMRGFHSHRALEQVLLCVNGSVKIRLKTPSQEEVVELNDPSKGLYIGYMVWREMFDFTKGAVLLVLASQHYTETDYIRDYAQYLQESRKYFKEEDLKK